MAGGEAGAGYGGRDMGYLGQKLLATAMTDERDCWQFYLDFATLTC